MFSEDELLPLSGLQHLVFCERQWGLIHLEQIWDENRLTVEGRQFHDRVDEAGTEVRGNLRITHGLPLRSLRLGIVGRADVVEFHRLTESMATTDGLSAGVLLDGAVGLWRPFPVEYKRGRPKPDISDAVQLCAQALCLEEMLNVAVGGGALFYGKTLRRQEILFDAALREQTETLCGRMHDLFWERLTPSAWYENKCDACSLYDRCMPKLIGNPDNTRSYVNSLFDP